MALFNFWIGLLAPGRTPRAIVTQLHREIASIIGSREIVEKYARLGAEPMVISPQEFDAMMADELKTLGAIVQAAHLRPE